jgi:hypothetical protein
MRIGYARVSTDDQTLDLQRDALKRAKCRKIYEEHASGKNTTRPELEACLKSLREDDTLVIWRLDRLGRSLGDLIELTNELQSRRIDLESLTEKLDTGSNSMFFLSAIAICFSPLCSTVVDPVSVGAISREVPVRTDGPRRSTGVPLQPLRDWSLSRPHASRLTS